MPAEPLPARSESAASGAGRENTARRKLPHISIPPARRGIWILNVAILLVLAIWKQNFYGLTNLETVLTNTAILGIGAAGMTILIIAGAFDLSVSAVIGLAPILAVEVAGGSANVLLLALLSLIAGGLLGLANGLIITRGRVAPFVATLGTLFVFGSVSTIIN